jgi:hypothetical protein
MPTHTPSPHRFLATNPPAAPAARQKPPTNLRKTFTFPTPKPTAAVCDKIEAESKKVTPAKRFVLPPHRRTPSAEEDKKGKNHEAAPWLTAHAQLTPWPKPRRKFERVESIEETLRSSPIASGYGNDDTGIEHSAGHGRMSGDDAAQQEHGEQDEEMLFMSDEPNKRRRVSPAISPSSHQPSEPTTPIATHNNSTHRFIVPPPRTPALFSAVNPDSASISHPTSETPAQHRPAFILPPQPTSPPKPSRPLPEIFSPSRKTQKYIPGGLASTLQGWIIETANTGFAAQERSTGGGVVWGRDREDGVRLKVQVIAVSSSVSQDEGEVKCFPGQIVFVRGDTEPGLYNASRAPGAVSNNWETRVLLAGQGGARGAGGIIIRSGARVGIRSPMWEVDVQGETWVVGVDWVLL